MEGAAGLGTSPCETVIEPVFTPLGYEGAEGVAFVDGGPPEDTGTPKLWNWIDIQMKFKWKQVYIM